MTAPSPVSSVEFAQTSLILPVGDSAVSRAIAKDAAGNALRGQNITYASIDPKIANVSASGEVTGIAPGSTTVTATTDGRSAMLAVTVIVAGTYVLQRIGGTPLPYLYSDEGQTGGYLSLEADVITFVADAAYTEAVASSYKSPRSQVFVENAPSVQTGSYESSGAELTMSGTRINSTARDALIAGDSLTFAPQQTSDGDARLYRRRPPVATVTIVVPLTTLALGQSAQAAVTLTDSTGSPLTHRVVMFTTSNAAVATVTPGGIVTAIAAGTAAISATSEGKVGTVGVNAFSAPTAAQLVVKRGG